MTKTTINTDYANLLEVTKVQGFAKLERKATFEFFKNITLAKSLLSTLPGMTTKAKKS